jgi:hypothetical protein
MVIRRVYDLLAQCRLVRWEEEYNTMETLALEGWERLPYIRFLCAGQEVKLRVHATANVTVAISDAHAYHEWVTRGFESDALKSLVYERDVASVAIDYCVKDTGDYYLLILNESPNPVDITIEIVANRREPSARSRMEATVNRLAGFARTKEPLHQVLRRIPKRPPGSASNDDAEKSDWPAGS